MKNASTRTVNVAKLFPEKNRSIDSIPYDHARVSLATSTDDYINAGFVKVNEYFKFECGQKHIKFVGIAIVLNRKSIFYLTLWGNFEIYTTKSSLDT